MQEYEKALEIAEELDQIYDYKDRLVYWDKNLDVFGNASIIVFDTVEEKYEPFHGILQSRLSDELGGDSERYKAFWIFPADATDFTPFMLWCIDKVRRGRSTTIMDEPYYWKKIEQNQFPEDFLTNLLTAAEKNRNSVSTVRNAWVSGEMTSEEAEKCFFFYGNRDFSEGEIEGISGTTATLFIVCMNLKTRALPEYGQLFFQYFDGYHTASMVKFLRQQKKRLEAGEEKWFIPQLPPAPVEVGKEEISVTVTSAPSLNEEPIKKRRRNDDAERRKKLIYDQYDLHMKNGFNRETAIQKLVVNLKREFRTNDSDNRRKSIIRILRQRNNEEQ